MKMKLYSNAVPEEREKMKAAYTELKTGSRILSDLHTRTLNRISSYIEWEADLGRCGLTPVEDYVDYDTVVLVQCDKGHEFYTSRSVIAGMERAYNRSQKVWPVIPCSKCKRELAGGKKIPFTPRPNARKRVVVVTPTIDWALQRAECVAREQGYIFVKNAVCEDKRVNRNEWIFGCDFCGRQTPRGVATMNRYSACPECANDVPDEAAHSPFLVIDEDANATVYIGKRPDYILDDFHVSPLCDTQFWIDADPALADRVKKADTRGKMVKLLPELYDHVEKWSNVKIINMIANPRFKGFEKGTAKPLLEGVESSPLYAALYEAG